MHTQRNKIGVYESWILAVMMLGLPWRAASQPQVEVWISSVDLQQRLAEQAPLDFSPATSRNGPVIRLEMDRVYQTMLGFGSSLEPSTCYNLALLHADDRLRVMESLVHPTQGIGMNLMRLCMGTPDFTGEPWYSYNDLPPGQTDWKLEKFSIAKDRRYILPMLKLARKLNPDLLFFAAPWSPPGWMKSTGTMIGGHLLPECYPVYAEYFVKFLQAYQDEGIPLHAVTVQNEPGVDRAKEKDPNWFYPSCHWTGEQERDFIRDHLGPAFRRHGLTNTQIWTYDHNYNVRTRGDDPGLAYPRTVLSDAAAASHVSGVAFHGYAGDPEGMSVFHEEFPQVPIYFTEESVFGIKGASQLMDKLRNWASSYNAWVTMLDEHGRPNNGPFDADATIITLDPRRLQVTYRFDYFMYGQFMKFISRGAQRIESGPHHRSLRHVAFLNPDGTMVVVVANLSGSKQSFALAWQGRSLAAELPGHAVGTYRWQTPWSLTGKGP